MTDRAGDWLITYTGKRFYPLDPREDEIDIADIAHGLALTNRFTGQSKWPYSVAQHCCLMSEYVFHKTKSRLQAKRALLHDAAEAYICDLPRPFKQFLPAYKAVEDHILTKLEYKFNIDKIITPEIKEWDNDMLVTEARALMNGEHWWEGSGYPDPIEGLNIHSWTWRQAEAIYIDMYEELYGESVS